MAGPGKRSQRSSSSALECGPQYDMPKMQLVPIDDYKASNWQKISKGPTAQQPADVRKSGRSRRPTLTKE